MHALSFALIVVVIATGSTNFVLAESLTRLERQRLVAHLEMTEQELSDAIADLSSAQLQFRPSAESWNILEVLEHLVVAEPIY
ncbi:MAG TPA: DinB family protein, partial [Bryobacteraceae bacterium]|nr:DinB family protein [Bryobacteraceae bacterium]